MIWGYLLAYALMVWGAPPFVMFCVGGVLSLFLGWRKWRAAAPAKSA